MKNLAQRSAIISLALVLLLSFSFSLQARTSPQTAKKKININTASLSELQEIPRVGEKIAQRIIDFRKKHGKFKKIEEIMKVKGIGEKTFVRMKDLITVGDSAESK
jgi:comEA protein